MRTDLIAVNLARQWLQANAPHLASGWHLDVDEEVQTFGRRVKGMYEHMDAVFASQASLANAAIDRFDLQNVALLGAGTPTPLAPPPQKVLYWTDINPTVLEEAAAAGYDDTRLVDARSAETLQALAGAETVIATGLLHFLPDEAVRDLLQNLAAVGVRVGVFNNVDPSAGQELMDNWNRLGAQMYARTIEEFSTLLPLDWQVDVAVGFVDFVAEIPEIGQQLAQQPPLYNIYKVSHQSS